MTNTGAKVTLAPAQTTTKVTLPSYTNKAQDNIPKALNPSCTHTHPLINFVSERKTKVEKCVYARVCNEVRVTVQRETIDRNV